MAANSLRCVSSRYRALMTPLQRSTPLYGPSLWFCQSSSTAASSQTDFFNRNKQLNRPVSPHLSILLKNPQMTSMLSITHRITGVMMSFDVWAVTIAWIESGKTFPQFIESVQSLSLHPHLITTCKFTFAFPFTYHFFNGIRHLIWDSGRGFEMSTLYRSGYAVLVISFLSAIALTFYSPKL